MCMLKRKISLLLVLIAISIILHLNQGFKNIYNSCPLRHFFVDKTSISYKIIFVL